MERLAALSELPQLEPVVLTLGARQIAVVRIEDEVYAFSPVCTHRTAPLADGAVTWKRTILCPWHLGTFSLRTGKAMAGPPSAPLLTYPVVIADGVAYLGDTSVHDTKEGWSCAERSRSGSRTSRDPRDEKASRMS